MQPQRPNILLIGLDTLRADHLGCYGYGRDTSPHIDRYAAGGVVFANAYSTHIPTHPAFTTILTGKDVMRHGVVNISQTMTLPDDVPMLQEILSDQGYNTIAVDNMGRWFTRGFGSYRDYKFNSGPTDPWYKAEAVNNVLLPTLDEVAASVEPFFIFAHYWDPHTPYQPPSPFRGMYYHKDAKDPANHGLDPLWAFEPFRDYFASWMPGVTDPEFVIAQYDAEVSYMDVCLRSVFTRLAELGLEENTLVILFADHGEEFMDHDCYFDHHGLYEPNVHVPLIMRWPGVLPAATQRHGFVTLLDVAPTILEAIGLPHLIQQEGLEGQSLLNFMNGQTVTAPRDTLYLTESTWMRKRGVRTAEWKLIVAIEPDFHGKPPIELYHLPSDSGEMINVADQHPDIVASLRAKLDDWRTRRLAETGLPDPMEMHGVAAHRIGPLPSGQQSIPKIEEPPLPHREPGHGAPSAASE